MLDFVAQRYGVLPSVLLDSGSSLDVMISGVAMEYQVEQQKKQDAESRGVPYVRKAPNLTQTEMMKMLNAVKGRQK